MPNEDLVPLVRVAEEAIRRHLDGSAPDVPSPPVCSAPPRGVFVTLRNGGRLRGCVGRLEALARTLGEEVAQCAVAAATTDPRFPPITVRELTRLDIELSLLEPPEPAVIEDLDPLRYGVVVTSGNRRGVLLPAIEGVTDPVTQVAIARRKAGIEGTVPVEIHRFAVVKVAEPPRGLPCRVPED